MTNNLNINTQLSRDEMFRRITVLNYDPVTGEGCIGARQRVAHPSGSGIVSIPDTMLADPDYGSAVKDPTAFNRLRTRHDFEYWCVKCCKIRDKSTGKIKPFKLNAPQRYVATLFEQDRAAGRPIRFIMLKARQWGGSTLVQMYMAWIQ